MVNIKSKKELEIMRQCSKLVAQILRRLASQVKAGVSLLDLDNEAERLSKEEGAIPAFKGYMGYEHSLCTSVNEQVVHGIPSHRKLKEGDIVGLDFGLLYEGFYGDSAVTIPVGHIPETTKRLMKTTLDALYAGIRAARAGNTLKDVCGAIEATVRPHGYGIVKEFVGHGIGRKLHEEPQVPNYASAAPHLKLQPGMTLAIEPMINEGSGGVRVLSDKWTVVTVDGKLSAHYEHSIAVTDGDPEILTNWEDASFEDFLKDHPKKGPYG